MKNVFTFWLSINSSNPIKSFSSSSKLFYLLIKIKNKKKNLRTRNCKKFCSKLLLQIIIIIITINKRKQIIDITNQGFRGSRAQQFIDEILLLSS